MMRKNLLTATLLSVCMLMGMAYDNFQDDKGPATLVTHFTNEYFQNWQKNFVPKFCEHLEEQLTDIEVMKDKEYWIPNLFGIVLSLEHVDVRHACISVIDKQIISFPGNEGQVRIDVTKLIMDLSASYRVGTNPSLNIAEEGAVYFFSYGSFMLETSIKVDMDGGIWADKTTGFSFSGARTELQFTGSYVSQAFASIFTHIINTILDLLSAQAFILNQHERGLSVIHNALNFALAEVPTKQYLGNNVTLKGGIHRTPQVKGNESITLEWNFEFTVGDKFTVANRPNLAYGISKPHPSETYIREANYWQVEIGVTEFFLQSALSTFYQQGLLTSEPVVLDESAMGSFRSALQFQYTMKNEFTNAGFDIASMFCRVEPFAANHTDAEEPYVSLSKERFFALNTTVMVDMQCSTNQKELNVTDVTKLNGTEKNMTYAHVFTLLMKPMYISTKLNATNASLEIAMQNVTLEIEFDHITRSSIGPIDGGVNSFISYYVQPFIKPAVLFELETRPIPVGELIMNATGWAWFDFDQSHIEFYDHYMSIYMNPVFEHPHKRNQYNERIGPDSMMALPIVDTKEESQIPESEAELNFEDQFEKYLSYSMQDLDSTDNILMI